MVVLEEPSKPRKPRKPSEPSEPSEPREDKRIKKNIKKNNFNLKIELNLFHSTIINNIMEHTFRLYDFNVYNEKPRQYGEGEEEVMQYKKDEAVFSIQMFGISETGRTCSIIATDFEPFFYIKVNDSWTEETKRAFISHIKSKIGKYYEDSICSSHLVEQKKLYGFDGGKNHKFVSIYFKNIQSFNKVKNLWYGNDPYKLLTDGYTNFNQESLFIYESNIPPLLRFFHINDISPSGWISFPKNKTIEILNDYKQTTCDNEYMIHYKYLMPLHTLEKRVPYKICSFDIEASSSHGDFPVPIKSYKKLATNIVEYFEKLATITPEVCKQKLKQILFSAFGLSDKMVEIDLVYPKKHADDGDLDPEWLDARITEIFNEPVKKYTKNVNIQSISTMFENIGNDSDDEEDNTTKKIVKATKESIIDILCDKKFDRESKLIELNLLLNTIFPKLEGDKVTFIGSTFLRYGETEPYLNHCAVLGTSASLDGENIQLDCFKTEREVLLAWTNLIQTENPDIIIGYNIFGFDYEFMFCRAQETDCVNAFLQLSRNKGEICGNRDKETGQYVLEESSIVVASGQHDFKYIKMTGRLQIDMYNFFRKEENLTSYKLDYVAGHFIGDYVKKIMILEEDNQSIITSTNLTGLIINSFIHFEEIGHTVDYYNNGQKYRILSINKTNKSFIVDGIIEPDCIKKIRWCLAKDDVTPQDIFRMTNGSDEDRAIIAKYCIQDCNLVQYIVNKVDVLTGFIEMAKICSVPINFLVLRGQGIKLTSYVAKKCREKGTLIPVMEKSESNDGYEGAIVLEPKCDLYLDNPVACVDYASLYPSSMMSENLSHDSKVWTKEYDLLGKLISVTGNTDSEGVFIYDNLPGGYEYVDITYDTFNYVRKSASSAAEKIKCGYKICRFAQFPEGRRAIMPSILEELLQARKSTRKLIPLQTDEFMKNVLDKRQLAYKLTANSLYGQCGAKTSTFYEKDVAASCTATGRMLLTYAKRVIEECYQNKICDTLNHGPVLTKAEYIYGDSVASYCPVYIRDEMGNVEICTVEQLARKYGGNVWVPCLEKGKQDKEVCNLFSIHLKIQTWTDKGWTTLYRIIRHMLSPYKKLIRVITGNGTVDVTDDHSLLRVDGTEIKPIDCSIGQELLHNLLPLTKSNKYTSELSFISWLESHKYPYEFIFDCPVLKDTEDPIGLKILINDHVILSKIYLNTKCWPDLQVKFMSHEETNMIYLYILWNPLFEKVEQTHFEKVEQTHFEKVEQTHFEKVEQTHFEKVEQKSANPNAITEMIQLPRYKGYVYDLTTENHHFAAGIGSIIVHNTDSVFFTFNLETIDGEKIRGKKALEITIELAQEAGHLASSFLKKPHDLEYEKTFMPFCLLSKKRYVGMLYETDPEKCKRKEMGIVLKRRDNAPLVKDIYGGIIDILMKEQDINKATQFLKACLKDIVDEKYPMDKLIISKSLRSGYKNPKQIAHKVLADRMTARDPGNKPGPGDRIPFVYIHSTNKSALQGDKIETPTFILNNNLKIDYSFYITNQIMKPVQQVFALVLEKIWIEQKKIGKVAKFKKDVETMKKSTSSDKLGDKLEKMRNDEVKKLLFDEFLRETNNQKTGNQSVMKFFSC
jgi:DNA polymerase elongation subunit (family B)